MNNAESRRGFNNQRVLLRCGTPDDADFVISLLNDPSFIRHIGDKAVRCQQSALTYIDDTFISPLAKGLGARVVTLTNGEPIGMVGLFQRPNLDSPDLGFALLSEHHNKGYMFAAAQLFLQHHAHQHKKLYAITAKRNHASYALLQKLGFTLTSSVQLDNKYEYDRLLTYNPNY